MPAQKIFRWNELMAPLMGFMGVLLGAYLTSSANKANSEMSIKSEAERVKYQEALRIGGIKFDLLREYELRCRRVLREITGSSVTGDGLVKNMIRLEDLCWELQMAFYDNSELRDSSQSLYFSLSELAQVSSNDPNYLRSDSDTQHPELWTKTIDDFTKFRNNCIKLMSGKIPDFSDQWQNAPAYWLPQSQSEQVGADQPATAPQLKSEGKKNTNPESEVRPQ